MDSLRASSGASASCSCRHSIFSWSQRATSSVLLGKSIDRRRQSRRRHSTAASAATASSSSSAAKDEETASSFSSSLAPRGFGPRTWEEAVKGKKRKKDFGFRERSLASERKLKKMARKLQKHRFPKKKKKQQPPPPPPSSLLHPRPSPVARSAPGGTPPPWPTSETPSGSSTPAGRTSLRPRG